MASPRSREAAVSTERIVAAPIETTAMDARTAARFPVDLPATITSPEIEVVCAVRNVSLGGVFVHGALLPIETRAVLRFTLPQRRELEVACTARWSTADGTGLQFERLRSVDIYALT